MKKTNTSQKIKIICFCAALTALSAVIGYFCKMLFTFTPAVRLTFENLPILLSGIFFGPVPGLLTGICSDILSTAVSQYGIGGINPIVTLGAGSVGLIAGIFSRLPLLQRKRRLSLFISVFGAHAVGNMIIKSLGLNLLFGYPLPELLPRIPLYIAIALAEYFAVLLLVENRGIKKIIEGKNDL